MRALAVDTLVAVVVFTAFATSTERLIVGLSWEQIAATRLGTLPVLLLTGRPYGLWRDWVFRKAGTPCGPIAATAVDVVAFLSFQAPLYAAILFAAGATPAQMVTAVATAASVMVLIARPYGWLLLTARRIAGTAPSA